MLVYSILFDYSTVEKLILQTKTNTKVAIQKLSLFIKFVLDEAKR